MGAPILVSSSTVASRAESKSGFGALVKPIVHRGNKLSCVPQRDFGADVFS